MMTIVINKQCVPASRPRVTSRGTYTPAKYKNFKDEMREGIRDIWNDKPIERDIPVVVDIIVSLPVPKSLSKKKKALLYNKPHVKKPDKDNLEKALLDSMSGIVFEDDSQVYCGRFKKIYEDSDEKPYIIIEIKGIEND